MFYFSEAVSLKSKLLGVRVLTSIKRATVLRPSEEFQKKVTYVCSSASRATIPARFVVSHVNTRGAPTKKTKKCRLCPFGHRFQSGHRKYQREMSQNQLISQTRHRTENVRKIFSKFCLQAEI